jgi:hypothetical protein
MAYFNAQPGGFQGQGMPFGQPNGYFNNGFMQGQGVQYTPPQQPHKIQNILTPDEIAHLVKDKNQFSLALTQEEKLKACCNHQWDNRPEDALTEDLNDGRVVCQICGYKFKPLDAYQTTKESLQAAVDDILDVLQTIKLIYFDLDNTVAREYFQIIPLIERIPQLFEIASKNYAKHESVMPWANNGKNMSTMQAFAMLSSMLNGGSPAPGTYQQPGYGYAQQPQQGFQTYGANPAMGMPQPGISNGFGFYGAAPAGYQTQTQGFQTVYGAAQNQQPQPAPAAAPQPAPAPVNTQQAAPEAATATTDGNTKTVAASFKA